MMPAPCHPLGSSRVIAATGHASRLPPRDLPMDIVMALHTALMVTDLSRSQHFYGTVLGLKPIERSLKYPGVWYQIGAYQLHLILDVNAKHTPPPAAWGRHSHIALGVADLEVAIATLQAHGYPVQRSASGRAACFTQDPDGNVIELTQVAP